MGCGGSKVATENGVNFNSNRRSRKDNLVGVYELKSGDKAHKLEIQKDGSIIMDGMYAKSVIYCKKGQSFTFKMGDDCETSWGEFVFDEENSINGQIVQKDGDSYLVQGKLVKDGQIEKARGDKTVVIDDTTLQRYSELEKKLEQYEAVGVSEKVAELSQLAQRKHNSIKQKVEAIEELKAKCETVKTELGEESDEAKQAKEECEAAQLNLKIEAKEYTTICDKLKLYTGDLFDYNILSQQFDDLLNVVFGGDNGSHLENELEKMVEELEARKRSVDQEKANWKSAYTELKNCCVMLLKATNYWSTLSANESSDVTDVARETRSIVILTLESLQCVDNYLEGVEEYEKMSKEFRADLAHFSSKIYEYERLTGGAVREGLTLDEGSNILTRAREETAKIESWLYDTYLREKSEDSEKMRLQIMEEKLKLKNERRRFIGDWLNENVGDYLVDSTVVSPLPNHGLTSSDKEDTAEFDLEATYKKIAEDLEKKDKKRQLDETRAEIDLQEKIRERRQRQRRLRGQKLEEVKLKGDETAE